MGLTSEQRREWDERGFFIVRGFAEQAGLDEMIDCITHLARAEAAGEDRPDLYIAKEGVLDNRQHLWILPVVLRRRRRRRQLEQHGV